MEGEGLRDRASEFDELGARIFGLSFDPPDVNAGWVELMGFPFPLLSDVDRTAGAAMGVLREPGNPGENWPRRITYLIDPLGIIRRAYRVRDTPAHPAEVLAGLRSLRAPVTG